MLDLLWSSREVQKQWEPDTIIAIGHRFVQARYLNKDHRSRAIRLCEDISYNLRRVWGSLNPKTLEMSELLSELYTSMGHYREAQGVHESILRLVVEGDDGDDRTIDTMPSQTALKHVNLLKQSFLRLKGWDSRRTKIRRRSDILVPLLFYTLIFSIPRGYSFTGSQFRLHTPFSREDSCILRIARLPKPR